MEFLPEPKKIMQKGGHVAMDNSVQKNLIAVIPITHAIYYQPTLLLNILLLRGRIK